MFIGLIQHQIMIILPVLLGCYYILDELGPKFKENSLLLNLQCSFLKKIFDFHNLEPVFYCVWENTVWRTHHKQKWWTKKEGSFKKIKRSMKNVTFVKLMSLGPFFLKLFPDFIQLYLSSGKASKIPHFQFTKSTANITSIRTGTLNFCLRINWPTSIIENCSTHHYDQKSYLLRYHGYV